MAEEFTAKFKVDISDLKKNISEANKAIKLANTTFKSETAGMDKWTKDADGLSSKLKQLDTVLNAQKTVLSAYKDQLSAQQKAYEENGKRAEQLKAKLQELASNGVSKTDAEYKKYEASLKSVLREQDSNAKACEELKLKVIEQQGAVKQTEAAIQKYTTAQKDLERESTSLTKKVSEQEKELTELKSKYVDVAASEGKNSESAKKLAGDISKLSTDLKANKDALDGAQKEADELDKSFDEAGKSANESSGGFTIMKGALANLAAGGITMVVDALKQLAQYSIEAWKEFDAGRDVIIRLTGATGEGAIALREIYYKVAKQIVADSTTIGSAIGEVNTRFGVNGEELEKLALKYLQFSEITGDDVISTIDDTQKALSAYGLSASYASGFLDMLAKAGQQTGVRTSSLTSGIISNATAFQELGLDINQAVLFMGYLEKSGTNSETVLNGMRKALKNSAKDGTDLATALIDLQQKILANGDSVEGLNAAYELFGKSGDQIYGAIKNGTLNFEELAVAAQDAGGTVENTFNETKDATDSVSLAMQNLKIEVGKAFDAFLQDNSERVEKFISDIIDKLPEIMDGLEVLAWMLANIGKAVGEVIHPFVKLYETVKAFIDWVPGAFQATVDFIKGVWNALPDFFASLWDGVKSAAKATADWISNAFSDAVGFVKSAWSAITSFFSGVWGGIKSVFSAVGSWFSNIFSQAWAGIKSAWSGVKAFFDGIWQKIKSAFKLSDILSIGRNLVTGLWNGINDKVGWIIGKIKGFGKQVLDGIKKIFGIASPSKVMRKQVGNMLVYGLGEGITEKSGWLNKRAEKVVDSLKDVFTDGFDIHSPAGWTEEIGKYLDAGLVIGIEKGSSAVSKALNSIITDSRTEAQKVLDSFNVKLLESEKKYQDESARLEKEYEAESKRLKDSKSESDKTYLENLKKSNDDYLKGLKETADKERKIYDAQVKDAENMKKNIISVFNEMSSEVFKQVDELKKLQDDFQKKLNGATRLLDTVTVKDGEGETKYFKMANLNEQTAKLEDFYNLLMKVKQRGNVPKEFFNMLRSMSIEEATNTSEALLRLSDDEFNTFFADWERQREVEAQLAKDIYADEANDLASTINDQFGEIAANFLSIGENSADEFEAGFTEKLKGILKSIKSEINTALSGLFSGGNMAVGISRFLIPQMAGGGILRKGQIGLLEGNGAEAVVPLDRNKAWIRAVADDMINEVRFGGGVSGGVVKNEKTMKFTQNIYAPKQPSRIELYRQTKNLLALAESGV